MNQATRRRRAMSVVCLAGGTGGAKLAAGLQDVVGEELAVIANTADDVEVHGLLVSPDPDLVTYWLAGEIDEERGWGIRDDTFVVAERLERLGAPGWFSLSDRDLATCLYRTHFLAEGGTLTAAQAQIARGARRRGAGAADVRAAGAHPGADPGRDWRGLQEFLILDRGEAPIEAVELEGIAAARPTAEVLAALAAAEVVIVGPSNPVISIGPILARAGHARGDRGGAGDGRRGQPVGGGTRGQGADRGVHAGDRPPGHARPASPRSTRE